MKTILQRAVIIFSLVLGLQTSVKAQLVYIPDPAFRSYLNQYFGSCMVGDSIDSTCPDVLNAKYIDVSSKGISDLTGIEVFVNDTLLKCFQNQLTSLPTLPSSLQYFYCKENQLMSLPSLPSSLEYLSCELNQLTNLPNLPSSLNEIICYKNQLTSIPALPSSLITLFCTYNQLTNLPSLPSSLTSLYCDSNHITSLPALPNSLTTLTCSKNQLTGLPTLPTSLFYLDCSFNLLTNLPTLPTSLNSLSCDMNQFTNLPSLPDSLNFLSCYGNQITNLPILPINLTSLTCSNNLLTSLPALPSTLTNLEVYYNYLTSLPTLPSNLTLLSCPVNQLTILPTLPNTITSLSCEDNHLTSLPTLPTSLKYLYCWENQLTSLPELPSSLISLYCYDNPIACLPDLKNVTTLYFTNTLVNCLPSYGNVTSSTPSLTSVPLCDIFNSNGCEVLWNIEGTTYADLDSNCTIGNNEKGFANQKLNLYKNGVLDQQTNTNVNGSYYFDTFSNDFYRTQLDTTSLPFEVNCPSAGFYLDTISAIDSIKYDRDFALKCKGVDLAATSIYALNFRPASLRTVNILAGDLTNYYGFNCSAGTSGTVTITITGACKYVSSPSYAFTPTTVVGNVLTFSIADFGAISYDSTFDFNLLVDTTAALGSQICITVSVATTSAELNYSNNQLTQCFTVVGSYDPNDKAVYPQSIMEVNSDRWLTYTIRFQNTGTAEAEHIFITDTLSSLLDKSTFTLLSYSHEPFVQLYNDGLLKFNFPNIHLPDSNTNEPESHGYVQYKIRAKDSLTVGSTIDNTANIFFDFNAPVITNTVSNTVINCSLLQATITQTATTLEANLPNANYQWINCTTGTAILGANTQTYNPTQSGNYAVVVDFGTCKDTSNCISFSGVGINEIDASNISIQPNPFNNELKITLDKNYEGVIEIYNTIGELITSEKLQSRNVTLNTSTWNAGVYILKVATNDRVVVKKVVKR